MRKISAIMNDSDRRMFERAVIAAPLPSRRALPMPKFTRYDMDIHFKGKRYSKKPTKIYMAAEVDAWLRRYLSKEARA